MSIQVITPERSADEISEALRRLTTRIQVAGNHPGVGGLGGADGYGVAYECEAFSMHPFCWCQTQGCPYCNDSCTCDGKGLCGWCKGEDVWGESGNQDGHGAPNFWHRISGVKVWWYKWIGRSQHVANPNDVDVVAVIDSCAK